MQVTQQQLDLFREGLWKYLTIGAQHQPNTWQSLVGPVLDSKKAYEEIIYTGGLGFLQPVNEGGSITYDMDKPRFRKRYTPVIRALAVRYSAQSAQKDVYGWIKSMGAQLGRSSTATRNFVAAQTLMLGFSSTGTLAPDNLSWFNTAHDVELSRSGGATISNRTTNVLSALVLEEMIQQTLQHDTDRGIPRYAIGGHDLVVSPSNAGLATRIVQSEGLQGTADNDTNQFISARIRNIIVEQYLGWGDQTFASAFFLKPAKKDENPFFYMSVQPDSVDSDKEFNTKAILMSVLGEYTFDIIDWRGWAGALA